MELTNWAPEHSDALRELVCKGMSYAEAARIINLRFDTDYSRSAALGRARRLGLGPDDRPRPTMPAGPTEPVAIALARTGAGGSRSLELPWPVPPFKATKKIKLRHAAIEPRHVSLNDLESGDCRYPYGGEEEGEPITFCGHPKRQESSYCEVHHRLSCDPVEPVCGGELPEPLREEPFDMSAD